MLTDLLAAFGNLHTANMCKNVWADERAFSIWKVHDVQWVFFQCFLTIWHTAQQQIIICSLTAPRAWLDVHVQREDVDIFTHGECVFCYLSPKYEWAAFGFLSFCNVYVVWIFTLVVTFDRLALPSELCKESFQLAFSTGTKQQNWVRLEAGETWLPGHKQSQITAKQYTKMCFWKHLRQTTWFTLAAEPLVRTSTQGTLLSSHF